MKGDHFYQFYPCDSRFTPKQPDPNEKIIRVLDLYKFIDLLQTRSLHFSRLDTFWKNDRSEGRWSESELQDWSKTNFNAKEFNDWNAERVAVSCWSDYENRLNSKLWKGFCGGRYGVAIVSTPQAVNPVLFEGLKILKAEYAKYFSTIIEYSNLNESNMLREGNSYYPNVFRPVFRKSAQDFEHEKEIRFVIEAGIKDRASMGIDQTGVKIPFNKTDWIQEILMPVSTNKQEWELSVVKALCDKYEFQVPVSENL